MQKTLRVIIFNYIVIKGFYANFTSELSRINCSTIGLDHIHFIRRQGEFSVPRQPCGDGVTGGHKPRRRPALVDLTFFTLFIAFRPPSDTFPQVFFQFVTNFHTVKAIFLSVQRTTWKGASLNLLLPSTYVIIVLCRTTTRAKWNESSWFFERLG